MNLNTFYPPLDTVRNMLRSTSPSSRNEDSGNLESPYIFYDEGVMSFSQVETLAKCMKTRFCTYIVLICSLASAFLYVLTTTPSLPQGSKEAEAKSPCGSSPSEARNNGCHFDTLHYSWLPSSCADRELEAEFSPIGDVVLYADAAFHNSAVSDAEFRAGGVRAIVTTDGFLAKQCQYAWEKLRRTMTEGKMPDTGIWNVANMDRCAEFLADFPKGWEIRNRSDVRVEMGFLSCVEG
jgi:hypothetical protein